MQRPLYKPYLLNDDVQLGQNGYRITNYQKSEASTFIPRFGAGDATESNFDILKSKTVDGFDGGQHQRLWAEDNMVFGTEDMYPKYDDGVLYPVCNPTTLGKSEFMGKRLTASCVTADYMYLAFKTLNTPTNSIYRIDMTGTISAITLPANISNGVREIVSLVEHIESEIWVSTSDGKSMGYIPRASTTCTEVGSGTTTECVGGKLVSWNGQLYGLDGTDYAGLNVALRRHTGGKTSRTWVTVGDIHIRNRDFNAEIFVYNNRIIIFRADGIYAYDGVMFSTIEDGRENRSEFNYRMPRILKGYIYYFMEDGMYRFNGSMIEKMYDTSETGRPIDVCEGKNRLWFLYRTDTDNPSRYDKSMGFPYASSVYSQERLAVFNGKGFYTYARYDGYIRTGSEALTYQNEVHKVVHFNDELWTFRYYDANGNYKKQSTDETAADGTNLKLNIVTSIFDGDYPMIDKNLEQVEIVLDGAEPTLHLLQIQYRTDDFEEGTWNDLGVVDTAGNLVCNVWDNVPNGISFKQIQIRVSGTDIDPNVGIKQIVIRYNLVPEVKYEWQFTCLCYASYGSPYTELDTPSGSGTNEEGYEGSYLRGYLYKLRQEHAPFIFVDLDTGSANNATISASQPTVALNDYHLLRRSGFIMIDDEIMYYYDNEMNGSTINVVRGVLGTTATSHDPNSQFLVCYRVILKQIVNERRIIEDTSHNTTAYSTDQTGYYSTDSRPHDSEVTIILSEV